MNRRLHYKGNTLDQSFKESSENASDSFDITGSTATLDQNCTSYDQNANRYKTFSESDLTLDKSLDASRDLSYDTLDRSAEGRLAFTESEATLVVDDDAGGDGQDGVEEYEGYSDSEVSLAFTNSSLAFTISDVDLVSGWLDGKTPLALTSGRSRQVGQNF